MAETTANPDSAFHAAGPERERASPGTRAVPRFLIDDCDTKFTVSFDAVFEAEGARSSPPRSEPRTRMLTPRDGRAPFERNAGTGSWFGATTPRAGLGQGCRTGYGRQGSSASTVLTCRAISRSSRARITNARTAAPAAPMSASGSRAWLASVSSLTPRHRSRLQAHARIARGALSNSAGEHQTIESVHGGGHRRDRAPKAVEVHLDGGLGRLVAVALGAEDRTHVGCSRQSERPERCSSVDASSDGGMPTCSSSPGLAGGPLDFREVLTQSQLPANPKTTIARITQSAGPGKKVTSDNIRGVWLGEAG